METGFTNKPKLRAHITFKTTFYTEKYVEKYICKRERYPFAQLRVGILRLEIKNILKDTEVLQLRRDYVHFVNLW